MNVLTAFDHAGANPADEERWNYASKALPPSHTIPKGELDSGTYQASGSDGSVERRETGAGYDKARYAKAGFARERVTESESKVEPKRFDSESELQSIAERALALTRATGAAIALSADNDSEMICVASAGDDAPPVRSRLQVGSGFSGECVRTGRSLRCDDSETDDRVDRAGCKSLGIRSLVAVPIRQGSKVIGLLEVFSPQPYAFNADDIGSLQHLTGGILAAIQPGAQAENVRSVKTQPVKSQPDKAQAADANRSSPMQPTLPSSTRPRTEKPPAAKAVIVETPRPVTAAKPSSEPVSVPSATSQPTSAPARSNQPTCRQSSFRRCYRHFYFCSLMADRALGFEHNALFRANPFTRASSSGSSQGFRSACQRAACQRHRPGQPAEGGGTG